MKKLDLNLQWLKTPEDLFEMFLPKELLLQNIPSGQKVIINKEQGNVTINSIIGFDLTKKFKKQIQDISILKEDFAILAIYNKDQNIFQYFDIMSLNKISISEMPFEDRVQSLEKLPPCKVLKKINAEPVTYTFSTKFKNHHIGCLLRPKDSSLSKENSLFFYSKHPLKRQVIITSFYHGNKIGNDREVLFKCCQYRNGRLVNVGKTRVKDDEVKKRLIKSINKKKRTVALVDVVLDKRLKQKYSKIYFDKLVFDESFRNIVIDEERYFKPLVIISVRRQSRSVITTKTVYKNLNMLSGVL